MESHALQAATCSRRRRRSKKRKMIMMPLSNILPENVMIEVCSRLPVQSLVRFRCVSRSWYDLVSDPFFSKLHFDRAKQHNTLKHKIVFTTHGTRSTRLLDYQKQNHSVDLVLALEPPMTPPRSPGRLLASCNGLLLSTVWGDVYDVVLWNPCLGEYRYLPSSPKLNCSTFMYDLGYNPDVNDYEVVVRSVRSVKFPYHWNTELPPPVYVSVYSVAKDEWRRIPDVPYGIFGYGVLVNASLHWEEASCTCIAALDIGGEKFRQVPLPDFLVRREPESYQTRITEFRGQLCLFCSCSSSRIHPGNEFEFEFELWEMKDYGVKESWTKLFHVESDIHNQDLSMFVLCLTENGKVLMRQGRGGHDFLVLYDPQKRRHEKLDNIVGYPDYFRKVMPYVDSIVGLNNRIPWEEEEDDDEHARHVGL